MDYKSDQVCANKKYKKALQGDKKKLLKFIMIILE